MGSSSQEARADVPEYETSTVALTGQQGRQPVLVVGKSTAIPHVYKDEVDYVAVVNALYIKQVTEGLVVPASQVGFCAVGEPLVLCNYKNDAWLLSVYRVMGCALATIDALFVWAQCRVFKDLAVHNCSARVPFGVNRIVFNSGAAVRALGRVENRWDFILDNVPQHLEPIEAFLASIMVILSERSFEFFRRSVLL